MKWRRYRTGYTRPDPAGISKKHIFEYINEAIRNEKEGRVWKPEKSTSLEISEILQSALNQDKDLKKVMNWLPEMPDVGFILKILQTTMGWTNSHLHHFFEHACVC